MKIYTMYDTVAKISNGVFVAYTDNEAKRMIDNFYKSKKNEVSFNPSDYELWFLAEFNEKEPLIQKPLARKIYPESLEEVDE